MQAGPGTRSSRVSGGDQHLVLVIPGLCGPESDRPVSDYLRDSRPAALDRLLSRSRPRAVAGAGLEAALAQLFGVDAAVPLPVAALTWLADTGQPPAGWLMRLDPVHLRPDQSCLRLFDSHSFDISRAEADRLVAACNDFYREDGWQLCAPQPQRWYLPLPGPLDLQTLSPSRAAGQDINPCLPTGAAAAGWHARLNEIQMLLHGHPVNAERERRGAPPVNSVWPWGGGSLPLRLQPRVDRVLAGEPLAAGLAHHAGLPLDALPASAAELLAAPAAGYTLLVDTRLEWPSYYGDIETWLDALLQLEADWFVPLHAALSGGALASLEIHPCDGRGYGLTRGALRRFWKRSHRFESVCAPR